MGAVVNSELMSDLLSDLLWRSVRFLTLGGFFGAFVLAAMAAQSEIAAQKEWKASLRDVKVVPPEDAPHLSQESIDLALVMFGIEVPPGAEHPVYDPTLEDRGVTIRGAMFEKARVAVGPSAFADWSLLGSTLAHELEVHCQQSFLIIHLMDRLGLDGTLEAERQAYLHELANAERFGLTRGSQELIADTMEYFYPTSQGRGLRTFFQSDVRKWMALNLIGTRPDF